MMNKQFLSVRGLTNNQLSASGKPKVCRKCGSPATKEMLFDVGNDIAVIERYCDLCLQAVLASRSSA